MTPGEQLLSTAPLKTQFRDAHERRSYMRGLEIARRLVDDPSLLSSGRDFLERHVRHDPGQRAIYELWTDTLRLPAREVARRLVADDERGSYLRETAPVFTIISRQAH